MLVILLQCYMAVHVACLAPNIVKMYCMELHGFCEQQKLNTYEKLLFSPLDESVPECPILFISIPKVPECPTLFISIPKVSKVSCLQPLVPYLTTRGRIVMTPPSTYLTSIYDLVFKVKHQSMCISLYL